MDLTCFNWIQFIKKDPDISFHAKAIAMYLGTFMNPEQDIAWPSQARIAGELGISKPTVIKYLQELKDKDYLTVSKVRNFSKGGDQDHNCYQIDFPLKVVKEIYYLSERVVKLKDKGSKSHAPKVVNHVNPNNNRITKNNNTKKVNFPFWNDEQGWIDLGNEFGIKPRSGESWDNFRNRLKNLVTEE